MLVLCFLFFVLFNGQVLQHDICSGFGVRLGVKSMMGLASIYVFKVSIYVYVYVCVHSDYLRAHG